MKTYDNLIIEIDYRITGDVDVATFDNIYTVIPDKVYHEFSLFLRNIMKRFEEAELEFHIHTSQMECKKDTISWECTVYNEMDQPACTVCTVSVILRVSNRKFPNDGQCGAEFCNQEDQTNDSAQCTEWIMNRIRVNGTYVEDYEEAQIQAGRFVSRKAGQEFGKYVLKHHRKLMEGLKNR